MDTTLEKVTFADRSTLASMMELYLYEFSVWENTNLNQHGLYGYPYLDYYFTEPKRFAYFIKVEGKLAGFALVCDYCYVREDDALFMAEFFILKKYRNRGIGKKSAIDVIKKHPGKWELTLHPENKGAYPFWYAVIKSVSKQYEIKEQVQGVYDEALATAFLFEVSEMT